MLSVFSESSGKMPLKIAVKDLPDGIQHGLRKLKFGYKNIDLSYSDSIKHLGLKRGNAYPVIGAISMEGYVDRMHVEKPEKIDIPRNAVLFWGIEAKSHNFGKLVIPKSMVDKVIGKSVKLDDRQHLILGHLVDGRTPKIRMRLLAMDKVKRSELDVLEKMGLITIDMKKRTVSATAKGKSVYY